jgi:hypothetical protein
MLSLSALLTSFIQRVQRKTFLRSLTAGWKRRIGIVVEDRQLCFCLVFNGEVVEFIPWKEDLPVDFLLRGQERDFMLLFAGEALTYQHAKQQIKTSGPFRDQLKLEALIRLTCEPIAAE